ncbi:MAG: phasin family protein [Herminiimonas sp.]|nr:phasin family protein [Herminiimonas sp.]
MSDLFTPLSDLLQTHLETSRRVADTMFAGTGKIDHTVLEVSHHALDEHFRYAQAIGNSRDPQMLSNLHTKYWAAKPGEFQMFQKKMVQIVTELQNDLGRVGQSYLEQISLRAMRGTPAGTSAASDPMSAAPMNPFSSAVSVWQNTMRGMSTVADQTISAAREGVSRTKAATNAMMDSMAEAAPVTERRISTEEVVDVAASNEQPDVASHAPGRYPEGSDSQPESRSAGQSRRK